MLEKINQALDEALDLVRKDSAFHSRYVQKLLDVMEYGVPYTADQLLTALELKSKTNLRKNYLSPALAEGFIVMGIPKKPTSRNQTYVKK